MISVIYVMDFLDKLIMKKYRVCKNSIGIFKLQIKENRLAKWKDVQALPGNDINDWKTVFEVDEKSRLKFFGEENG